MTLRIFLCFTVAAFEVLAQTPNRPTHLYGPMADPGASNLPAQKIGADDLLSISVYDAPELTRTVRVSADGTIRLPMLKQRIEAGGKLPADIESVIARALIAEGILIDPVVTVGVSEYHSRPISVVGSVRRPVTFQAVGHLTLLEALAKAEGLHQDAGSEILITQPRPGEPGLVTRIAVKELFDQAKPELNILLRGGEEIRVPEARKIFVVGNVKKPGGFMVRESNNTTLLKVLAEAEGLAPFAAKQAFIYRRDQEKNEKKEIPIELAKIMERKAADVPLEPEDLVYIPDNRRARATIGAIEKTAAFGLATVSGMLIWRGR
ncbi:MAG: hypothetical protein FJW40_02900 [Acidobacteria bacterium]|nr:hypothetical protein [Acidobacteriota bacterium]